MPKSKKDVKKIKKEEVKEEKVCEIFDVEKDGKEKEIVACGEQKVEHATEQQVRNQNKILKWVLIGIGIFVIAFLATIFYIESTKHFEYKGINFERIKEGKVIFYKTSFPMSSPMGLITYNVYMRTDPRKLDKIHLEGERINLRELIVVNTTDDFVCDGDGSIAMINLAQVMKYFGAQIIQDPKASCDSLGRYIFLEINPANETKIVQNSETCYTMYVSNCEILKATEKFMLEKLVDIIPTLQN